MICTHGCEAEQLSFKKIRMNTENREYVESGKKATLTENVARVN